MSRAAGLGNTARMWKRAATIRSSPCSRGVTGRRCRRRSWLPGDLLTTPWSSDVLLGSDGHLVVAPPFPSPRRRPARGAAGAGALGAGRVRDGDGGVLSAEHGRDRGRRRSGGGRRSGGSDPPRAFPLLYRAATRQLVAVAPPGTVLREHHHYGCLVSAGVHDNGGRPLRPSKAMAELLLAGGPTAPAAYKLLAAKLGTSGATAATPEAATAFTTQTVSAWATKALADVVAQRCRRWPRRRGRSAAGPRSSTISSAVR